MTESNQETKQPIETDDSLPILIHYENQPTSAVELSVFTAPRRSARKTPNIIITMKATQGEETFEDKMTLMAALPTKSYKLFVDMQKKLPEQKEGEDEDELDAEAFETMVDIFPDFIKPLIIESSFEATEEELRDFDVDLKFSLMSVLMNTYKDKISAASKK